MKTKEYESYMNIVIRDDISYQFWRRTRNILRDQSEAKGLHIRKYGSLINDIKFIDKYLSEWELKTKEII